MQGAFRTGDGVARGEQSGYKDDLNPAGCLYHAGSTLTCMPTSLSQEASAALSAQGDEMRLRRVIGGAGFRSVRRAAETPFNMVLETRSCVVCAERQSKSMT